MSPKIGAPAPEFKAQAVVDGQFKTVSLEDYKVGIGIVDSFTASDADCLSSMSFYSLHRSRASLSCPPFVRLRDP